MNAQPLPRALLVAYHFPPLAGSSGIQRALRLAQHLPSLGWTPIVLTAHPRAYERTSTDLSGELPRELVVRRAQAWDTARHFAVAGRYVAAMARPDRWVSWRFDAVRAGIRLIHKFQPRVIWSTYPIATAHLIGAELQRRSGIPWVADFRDPMAQDGYPSDPVTHRQYQAIEHRALLHARFTTFTSPGAAAEYARRYPEAGDRIRVVENGYDEASFTGPEVTAAAGQGPLNPGAITLLHSGIVYPSERDPTHLMVAVRRLHDAGNISPATLRLRFRASIADELLHRLARQHGVDEYIETCAAIPYKEALAEMLRADGLLVMQANSCNQQVPAKVYEYLRAGRPILGLADSAGDTAGVLRGAGLDGLAALESADDIGAALIRFLEALRETRATLPNSLAVRQASRFARNEAFARLFNTAAAG
jgi:glycosyltransferase involved in cell wall biosynthesis